MVSFLSIPHKDKFLIFILILLIPGLGFSQGIKFEHGTWNDVLAKAGQTHKPVFVDVYTSWCGPCKKMSKDIFPLEEVGKGYNANFICYQIDAEKGEGIKIAQKYNVMLYPTYLFIQADGVLFSKASGFMEAGKFIEVSKTALTDMNDSKPIAEWEKEYIQNKSNPQFILNYINELTKRGLPSASLFDDYLKLIPEEERISDIVLEMYRNERQQMKVNSFAFENLMKNKNKLINLSSGYAYMYLENGIMNTMREAATSKNEQLLETAIFAFDQLPLNPALKFKEEIYLEYYQKTGEKEKYIKHATDFCNNQLMKISPDSILYKNKKDLEVFDEQIKSGAFGKLDSIQIADLRTSFMAISERNRISTILNNIAREIFEKVSAIDVLQDALRWSKRSLDLRTDNLMWKDTYANLLYKSGRKKEAIAQEQEVIRFANKNEVKGLEENLRKMHAGEKTWKN